MQRPVIFCRYYSVLSEHQYFCFRHTSTLMFRISKKETERYSGQVEYIERTIFEIDKCKCKIISPCIQSLSLTDIQPDFLSPRLGLTVGRAPLCSLIVVCVSHYRWLNAQKKAASQSLAITRDTHNSDRERSSGKASLFNI